VRVTDATPSDWAKDLDRGAYDLHVHIAPDVMTRRVTDLELAHAFVGRGLAGFGLKSHYTSTAERAAVVTAAVPGIDVVGGLCLNAAVGGLNPMAVEIAAREGARAVWLPTVDAANHRATGRDLPPGATPPMWLALQEELAGKGLEVPPVDVLDADGEVSADTRAVFELLAEHGLVLHTGHLSAREIDAVVPVAVAAGVAHVVVTHPEFPQQDLTVEAMKALVDQGAVLERCYTTPSTGKYPWDRFFANIRATGVASTLITTDLGQPHNPPVEDGLPLMADALRAAEFTDAEIRQMIVETSRRLAGAEEHVV
jgi:hypothetical protein